MSGLAELVREREEVLLQIKKLKVELTIPTQMI
jgi:hypothetical protein